MMLLLVETTHGLGINDAIVPDKSVDGPNKPPNHFGFSSVMKIERTSEFVHQDEDRI